MTNCKCHNKPYTVHGCGHQFCSETWVSCPRCHGVAGNRKPDAELARVAAVDAEIRKDRRIGGKEAKSIHALLKGRR